jgi:hypothetical protein
MTCRKDGAFYPADCERERTYLQDRVCQTSWHQMPEDEYLHIRVPQTPHTKNVAHIAHGIPYLRRLLACLSPQTSGFYPIPVHVGFVVNKVTSVQVLLPALLFSFVSVIPPVLRSRLFISDQLCVILTNDRIIKQTLTIETTYSW